MPYSGRFTDAGTLIGGRAEAWAEYRETGDLDGLQNLTIDAYIRLDEGPIDPSASNVAPFLAANFRFFFEPRNNAVAGPGAAIFFAPNFGSSEQTADGVIPLGTPFHFMVTWDFPNDVFKIYIDGIEVHSTDLGWPTTTGIIDFSHVSNLSVFLGVCSSVSGYEGHSCNIDYCRMWIGQTATALQAAEYGGPYRVDGGSLGDPEHFWDFENSLDDEGSTPYTLYYDQNIAYSIEALHPYPPSPSYSDECAGLETHLETGAETYPTPEAEEATPMLRYPENYGAVADDATDCRLAFENLIAAAEDGDNVILSGEYYVNGSIVCTKRLVFRPAEEKPLDMEANPIRIRFGSGYTGFFLLRSCTLRDFEIECAGSDPEASGIHMRRASRLLNLRINSSGGYGISVDTREISKRVTSGTVASGGIVTLTFDETNDGNLKLRKGMVVKLYGYSAESSSGGGEITAEGSGTCTFPLDPGATLGALTGISKNITASNGSAGTCTATLNNVTGLRVGMYITTAGLSTNSTATPILTIVGNQITFATAGSGNLGTGTLQVVRGLVVTYDSCVRWTIEKCRVDDAQEHGIYIAGDATNTGGVIESSEASNGQKSGLWDESDNCAHAYRDNYFCNNNLSGETSGYGEADGTGYPAYTKADTATENYSVFLHNHAEAGSVVPYVTEPAQAIGGIGGVSGNGVPTDGNDPGERHFPLGLFLGQTTGIGKIKSELRGSIIALLFSDSGPSSRTYRAIAWSTAAPTTGTWRRGDTVFNSNAAAGAAPAWVCTSGGTPGTWRSYPVV